MFAGVNFDAWRRLFFFFCCQLFIFISQLDIHLSMYAIKVQVKKKTSTTIQIASLLAPIHLAMVCFLNFPMQTM